MSMAVQGVNSYSNYGVAHQNSVNFSAKSKVSVVPGKEEKVPRKTGNIGKAIASCFVTGLGQLCDGRIGTGFKQMLSQVGLGILSYVAFVAGMTAKNPAINKLGLAGSVVAAIGAFAVQIHSVVDAYKGVKVSE